MFLIVGLNMQNFIRIAVGSLSLLAAAKAYSYPNPISEEEKEQVLEICVFYKIHGPIQRKKKILNYCKGDVLMNEYVLLQNFK